MSTSLPNESQAFYDYLGRSLQSGGGDVPPEVILRKWRAEKEFEVSCEAIREGLADIEAGRVVPFEEVAAELRRKYGIAEK